MDFRGTSSTVSTRLAVHATKLTPQLENYDLYHGYRELPTSYEGSQPFMLAFNLASVMDDELKIKRINKSASQDKAILQVEVAHKRKEAEGVHPFARNCSYRIELPEDLHDKNLTALWTDDNHLIVVESSNFIEVLTQAEETKEVTDVDTQVELAISVITPRKVKCVFKPIANVDIIRQGVAISELGLFNVKRIIQNGAFTYPDIGRPLKQEVNTYTVETETEVLPFEGYFIKVIKEKMADFESKEKADKEKTDIASEEKVDKEKVDIVSEEKVDGKVGIASEEKVDGKVGIASEEKVDKEKIEIASEEKVVKEKIEIASEENLDKEKVDIVLEEKVDGKVGIASEEKVDQEKADIASEEKVHQEKVDIASEEKVKQENVDIATEEKVDKEKIEITSEENLDKEKVGIASEEKVDKEKVGIASEEKVDNEKFDIASKEMVDKEKADIASKEKVDNEKVDILLEEKVDKEKTDVTLE